MNHFSILASIFLFLIGNNLLAQKGVDSLDFESKPKIGLVFSGGVAHGLAHIGVLKYMEEVGVDIDYITGTSMGAIVGGLKAMGWSADEIALEVSKQNWAEIIYNRVALDKVAPVEKFYHNKMPFKLLIDRSGVRLPLSLVGGHNLDMVIARQYAPANYINSFDNLPIPFRCVASDIVTGEKVVLEDGYLGRAIRASMSMPLIFKPVERNGTLLVDGGLVRNYPVEEVAELGAEIIIGCDVGYKLLPAEELSSSIELLYQAGFMSMHKDALLQKELTNIHIEPDVKDFSVFGFERYEELIELGYNAAKSQEAEFEQLVEYLSQFPDSKKTTKKLILQDSLDISQIAAINCEPTYADLIRNRFDDGKLVKYSADDVNLRMNLIYGTKNFSSIDYSYEGLYDGSIGLNLYSEIVKESSLGINVNYFGKSKTSLLLRGEMRNLLGSLSRFNAVARISNNSALQLEYLKRFGKSKNFYFALDGKLEREELPIYKENKFLQEFKRDIANGQFHLGLEPADQLNAHLYYRFQNEILKPRIFNTDYLTKYESNQHVAGWSLKYNSINDQLYGNRGVLGQIQVEYFFTGFHNVRYNSPEGAIKYPVSERNKSVRIMGQLEHVKSLSKKWVIGQHIAAGISNSKGFKGIFRIGGTDLADPFGLAFIGKYESHLTLSRFIYLEERLSYEIYKDWFVALIGNVVYGEEAIPAFKDISPQSNLYVGAGVAMVYKSPLGPIVINVGFSQDGFITDFGMGHKYIF